MRTPLPFLISTTILAFSAQAQTPTHGFCVENQSQQTALFVVSARDGSRKTSELAPQARLCTDEPASPIGGFVSVFYSQDEVEGCSRLTPAGAVQVLLKYADFDNCTWQIGP